MEMAIFLINVWLIFEVLIYKCNNNALFLIHLLTNFFFYVIILMIEYKGYVIFMKNDNNSPIINGNTDNTDIKVVPVEALGSENGASKSLDSFDRGEVNSDDSRVEESLLDESSAKDNSKKTNNDRNKRVREIAMYILMVLIVIIIILLLLKFCSDAKNDGKGIIDTPSTQNTTTTTTIPTGVITQSTTTTTTPSDITLTTTTSTTGRTTHVFPGNPTTTRTTTRNDGNKNTTKKTTTTTTTKKTTTTTTTTTQKKDEYTYTFTSPTTETFRVTIYKNGKVWNASSIMVTTTSGKTISSGSPSGVTISKVLLDMNDCPNIVVYDRNNSSEKFTVRPASNQC